MEERQCKNNREQFHKGTPPLLRVAWRSSSVNTPHLRSLDRPEISDARLQFQIPSTLSLCILLENLEIRIACLIFLRVHGDLSIRWGEGGREGAHCCVEEGHGFVGSFDGTMVLKGWLLPPFFFSLVFFLCCLDVDVTRISRIYRIWTLYSRTFGFVHEMSGLLKRCMI